MLDKILIQKSFAKAAASYEANSEVQQDVCRSLAGVIKAGVIKERHASGKAVTSVLDIGCGTGALFGPVSALWPTATLFGCDIAPPMLAEANRRAPLKGGAFRKRPSLLTADFDALPYTGSSFDVCVSSLAYQWAPSPEAAFAEAARVLKPGGSLYFSTLGPDTLSELRASYAKAARMNGFSYTASEFHPYKDKRTLRTALEAAGFTAISIETKPLKMVYQDMWTLLKRLKNIGAGARGTGGTDTLAKGALLKRAAKAYRADFPSTDAGNGVVATYDVLYITAAKTAR